LETEAHVRRYIAGSHLNFGMNLTEADFSLGTTSRTIILAAELPCHQATYQKKSLL
jgi:hypothetical protein